MKPSFNALRGHYPRLAEVSKKVLFEEIGWDDLIPNPDYDNTCAIRVSLALIKCGIHIPGRMRIRRGAHKGALIEPGQARLSKMLAMPAMLGAPEKFDRGGVDAGIGERSGLVAFWGIPSYNNGGHIDIISPDDNGLKTCGSRCYFKSSGYWFWALP